MNIVLLSGGSGKRLWPLSNDIRSKQFIKLFKNEQNELESMLQRVYRQIKEVDKNSKITIATAKSQVSSINNQLTSDDVSVSVEPCRRDTFPAIALVAAFLKYEKNVEDDEVVIVCPIDPYVQKDYFKAITELENVVRTSSANLCLMGIEPTYPSEKYGYIIPKSSDKISSVSMFKEKPTEEKANEYIKQGALWNAGVFGFKLGYMIDKAHQLIEFKDYKDLFNKYETLTKISFDYAVVEHEKHIDVIRYSGEWKDIGTWNTLAEEMGDVCIGKGMYDETCDNINIINELNIPILCMGIKDAIVCASPDGILVSDKGQSSYIKPFVDNIDQEIMYAEKSWGSFTILDINENSLTIKVVLKANNKMNYHSHNYRDEIWNITTGEGEVIMDGTKTQVKAGDSIKIPKGVKHTVIAKTELSIIEVQFGKDIHVGDKIKYEL